MSTHAYLDFAKLTWQEFEDFCRALFEKEFVNVVPLGRNAQGADLIAEEIRTSPASGQTEILRWWVQVKHRAQSGDHVRADDLSMGVNTLDVHKAHGFLLVTSTELAQGAIGILTSINDRGQYKATWWDRHVLTKKAICYPQLVGQFFGPEMESWARRQRAEGDLAQDREDYLTKIRERYRFLPLRGLAPELYQGPLDLPLARIYVELSLEEGMGPLERYETTQPDTDTSNLPDGDESLVSSTSRPESIPTLEGRRDYRPVRIGPDTDSTSLATSISMLREGQSHFHRLSQPTLWDFIAQGKTIIIGGAGAGKTTTLHYLALALAGEEGSEVDPRVRGRLPLVANLGKYARTHGTQPDYRLVDHLCSQFHRTRFAPLIERELENGQCLVLLDGLDQVNNPSDIVREIEEFAASYGNNLIVVTTRPETLRTTPLGMGFKPASLTPMDRPRIARFIQRWFTLHCRGSTSLGDSEDTQTPQKLLQALDDKPKLLELAGQPLMLAIMILMYWRGSSLPNRRIEVYSAATNTLLEYWPASQDRGQPEELNLEDLRVCIEPVAYRLLSGNGVIGEDEFLEQLAQGLGRLNAWKPARAKRVARVWLSLLSERSGLVVKTGVDQEGKGVYAFLHQSFAEYLAACWLKEKWIRKQQDFVIKHIHKSRWNEVIPLFVAQLGIASPELATKALRAVIGLGSPWEAILQRDHLLAAECLSEGIVVSGSLRDVILRCVVMLLTSEQPGLRARALEVVAAFRGTQYQRMCIELTRRLTRRDWPIETRIVLVEALVRLGEHEECLSMLADLRDTCIRRGESDSAARIIEMQLITEKGKTLTWLLEKALAYGGSGLEVIIERDPISTIVRATDESFGQVAVGRSLSSDELRDFMLDLSQRLLSDIEQECLNWVISACNQLKLADMRVLASTAHLPRVRRLAAEWLLQKGELEQARDTLVELSGREDGNVFAVKDLALCSESEHAISGAYVVLSKTSDPYREFTAATILGELGLSSEESLVLSEVTLSKTASDELLFASAIRLLQGSDRELGRALLRYLSKSVENLYRCEAATQLGKLGSLEEAYEALLDIVFRRGLSDRPEALTILNDARYDALLKTDGCDPRVIAEEIVSETADKYSTLGVLAQGEVLPAVVTSELGSCRDRLMKDRSEWEEDAEQAWNEYVRLCKRRSSGFATEPVYPLNQYRRALEAYLLREGDESGSAHTALRTLGQEPSTPPCLRRRCMQALIRLTSIGLTNTEDQAESDQPMAIMEALAPEGSAKALTPPSEVAEEVDIGFAILRFAVEQWDRRGELGASGVKLRQRLTAETPKFHTWLQAATRIPGVATILVADHLLSIFPSFVRALVTKAEALRMHARYNEVDETLELAQNIDPSYAAVHGIRGNALRDRGKYVESIRAIGKALELEPHHLWAWRFKADTERTIGAYDQALASTDEALAVSERDSMAWRIRAETLENAGRRDEALLAVERGLEVESRSAELLALKALILQRMGQTQVALKHAEQALEIEDDERLAWKVRSECLHDLGRADAAQTQILRGLESSQVSIRLCAVLTLAEVGNPSDAATILPLVHDVEPGIGQLVLQVAGTLNDLRSASKIEQILADDTASPGLRVAAAQALEELESPSALSSLRKVLHAPEPGLRRVAASAVGPIADESTLQDLAELMSQDDSDVAMGAAAGLAFARREFCELALVLMMKVLEHKQTDAALFSRLGVLLRRLDRRNDSIAAHNRAIDLDQETSQLYSARAFGRFCWCQYEEAKSDYQQAIALDPNRASPWAGLADCLFELGQTEAAANAWWRAKSVASGDTEVMAELALGLWALGRCDQSKRLWRRAVSRQSKFASDWDWMEQDRMWGPRMVSTARELVEAMKLDR